MSTETLSPILLLQHEAVHAATHERGMLWRAIEPQPILGCEDENGPYYQHPICRELIFGPLTFADREYPQAACQPGALCYVQEEWRVGHLYPDKAQIGIQYRDRRNNRILNAISGYGFYVLRKGWQPPGEMAEEVSRAIIEITQVEVKRARGVSPMDHLLLGIEFNYVGKDQRELRARQFHQIYDAKPGAWGFLYHYTVKERR